MPTDGAAASAGAVASLVSRASIEDAHRGLDGVAERTPLLRAHWLSDTVGSQVRLKCENLQRAGAFKIRGAYTAVARLSDADRARGVIAYSSGNHAQGVALAAKLFGIRAVVVMPTTSLERQKRAEAIAADQGLTIVPAFDDPDIIAGQGTTAIEILAEWPDVETILVPIGGGGLISGIAAYVKQTRPDVRVIGVEPESANAMKLSLAAGEPVTIPPARTVADGLMPVRPGDLTFAHAREFVDDIVLVDDDAILDATRRLIAESKLIVEFSGAATVAALLSRAFEPNGSQVAAVLSGGNLDPVRALELLAGRS